MHPVIIDEYRRKLFYLRDAIYGDGAEFMEIVGLGNLHFSLTCMYLQWAGMIRNPSDVQALDYWLLHSGRLLQLETRLARTFLHMCICEFGGRSRISSYPQPGYPPA